MQISADGNQITMRLPDNWHFHFRQGELLAFLVPICLQYGWRARLVAEPNTDPAKTNGHMTIAYKVEIETEAKKHPRSEKFEVIPALQITEHTTKEDIYLFHQLGGRVAKVYPLNVTTNSANGVYDYIKIYPALAACEALGIRVQFHAQHPSYDVEGWYKEIRFLELIAEKILNHFLGLRISIEHIQSALGVQWVESHSPRVVAGVTIQHMVQTIDDVIGYSEASGGKGCAHNMYKPHAMLLADQAEIIRVILAGNPKFFYAGDDAWHFAKNKHCAKIACGAANTLATLAKLTKLFKKHNALHLLEPFTSEYGANFYGFPLNEGTLTILRNNWTIDKELAVPGTNEIVIPWCAGDKEEWQVAA